MRNVTRMTRREYLESIKRENVKKAKEYYKNPKKCKFCGEDILFEKRQNIYCNRSCRTSAENKGVRRNGKELNKCLNCGNKVKENKNVYCSLRCQQEHRWKLWCAHVTNIGYFPGYDGSKTGGGVSRPKRYILSKQEGKCAICGISEWMGEPVPFVLDHIDGDATNWEVTNIRVVCRNCDGQLPTYSGKNKGNGKRKKLHYRDKDGKYRIKVRIQKGSII